VLAAAGCITCGEAHVGLEIAKGRHFKTAFGLRQPQIARRRRRILASDVGPAQQLVLRRICRRRRQRDHRKQADRRRACRITLGGEPGGAPGNHHHQRQENQQLRDQDAGADKKTHGKALGCGKGHCTASPPSGIPRNCPQPRCFSG